jgi:hypothetical protein
MHLRPPSFSQGFQSFLWALFFGAFIWVGLISVGVGKGEAFLIGAALGGLIFFFVRLYGGDEFPDRRR